MTPKPGYYVQTWDHDRREFTPQTGVPAGPHTKWGLRRALRQLQAQGYDTHRRGAWAVLVELTPAPGAATPNAAMPQKCE